MLNVLITLLYLSLIFFTIAFQIGLVLGKPWGEWTMGGLHKGVLPKKLRVGALISMIILFLFALFTIDLTGILGISLHAPEVFKWFIIGYNVLAVILNSITKSQKERRLWQPVTILMLLCSLWLFLR